MNITPICHDGYNLMHRGSIALAEIENTGMKVDKTSIVANYKKAIDIKKTKMEELKKFKEWTAWRRRFGQKTNPMSSDQFAEVFFNILGYECIERTDKGKPSTDEEVLSDIDNDFVRTFVEMKKMDKVTGTFLKGIISEIGSDGFLHPNFNLHIARTFRSSSDSPNFQNLPTRNELMARFVRSNFISRFGKKGVITENDYKGVEVSVSACYHKDKNFIKYITNPEMDMHGDMAKQLYFLEKIVLDKKMFKKIRYGAKNMFVFPQFYGDFYKTCAKYLWKYIQKGKLTLDDGTSLYKHLKLHGIKERGLCEFDSDPVKGTFEYHLKEVEYDFWNNRFGEYGKWKNKWYEQYIEKGYFDMFTGFRVSGNLKRNQIINYPVQGSAFHCLLWSLCEIMNEMRKMKMKSVIVGQIHDSIIGDVLVEELSDYLALVREVSTNRIRKHWGWINVPLTIETEVCPINKTWFDKKEFHFDNDNRYILSDKEGKKTVFENQYRFLKQLAIS